MRGTPLTRGVVAAAFTLFMASAAPSGASVIWEFAGNCTDCATAASLPSYPVTATLVLDGYVEGTALQLENVVSFSYSGSNLLDPYIATQTPTGTSAPPWQHYLYAASGHLTTNGSQVLDLRFGDGLAFILDGTGDWFTCGRKDDRYYAVSCSSPYNNDNGTGGNFSVPTPSVPEPAIFGLLAMSALGLVRQGRRQRL